jgi:hypothetical protein
MEPKQDLPDPVREHQRRRIDRRSFLNGAGRFAVDGLTPGASRCARADARRRAQSSR